MYKKLFSYIASRKLVWSRFYKKDVLILSVLGSEYIIPCLGNYSYSVLNDNKHIYITYILNAFMKCYSFDVRAIRMNYFICMIEDIDPGLIVNFVDNNPLFWELDKKISSRYVFLTIQNGTQHFKQGKKIEEEEDYKHIFIESKRVYYSNLACISKYDVDYYEKNNIDVGRYYPVGSLKLSDYIYNYTKKRKKIDICVVDNSINTRPENKKLWEFIVRYMQNNTGILVCIALKKMYKSDSFISHMRGLECFEETNAVIVHWTKNSSHYLSDISKVTIGMYSTLLRQTFSRGNKIYPLNFSDESLSAPYDLICCSMNPNYKKFEENLDQLLKTSDDEYQITNNSLMKYLDIFEPNNTPKTKLTSLIESLIRNKGYVRK